MSFRNTWNLRLQTGKKMRLASRPADLHAAALKKMGGWANTLLIGECKINIAADGLYV